MFRPDPIQWSAQTAYLNHLLVTHKDVPCGRTLEVLLDLHPKDRHHLACQGWELHNDRVSRVGSGDQQFIDGSYPFFRVFHGHTPRGFPSVRKVLSLRLGIPRIACCYRSLSYSASFTVFNCNWYSPFDTFFSCPFVFKIFHSRSCYSLSFYQRFSFSPGFPRFACCPHIPMHIRTCLCYCAFPGKGVSHMKSAFTLPSSRKYGSQLNMDEKTSWPQRWVTRRLTDMK